MRIGIREREIVRHTAAAMGLNGPVDDLAGHVGRHHLDHGNFGLGHFISDRVHHVGGAQREQTRLVDHAARFGHALFPDRLPGHRFAESNTGIQAFAH